MLILKNILINIVFILSWNMTIFFMCIKIKDNDFNPEKKMFREKNFEKSGTFYIKNLKIKKWKDYLPQYTSKTGFSKKSFISKEINYINQFVAETCRAEWNHKMCLLAIFPIILVNSAPLNYIFSFLVLVTNIPYIFIQRFNRLRLLQLKKHLFSKEQRYKKTSQIKISY